MTIYIVRVELHQAAAGDYENLHRKMEQSGFSRKILADDGKYYALPTAEYCYTASSDATAAVLSKAYDIAKMVKINPAVLVTECKNIRWRGLIVV